MRKMHTQNAHAHTHTFTYIHTRVRTTTIYRHINYHLSTAAKLAYSSYKPVTQVLQLKCTETIFLTLQVHDTSGHTTSVVMVLGHLYINWTSISPSSGNIRPTDSQRRTSVGWNEISDMTVCHFFSIFQQFHHYVQRCNTSHQSYRADATRSK